jgi:choline dehydrogenase-like flavoprotein
MRPGPALSAVLQRTTLESSTTTGAHDAVVVGAGAAGGLAALLLAEAGLRVLVLDAGSPRAASGSSWPRRAMNHVIRGLADPTNLRFLPAAAVPMAKLALRCLGSLRQPVQSRCGVWGRAPEAFVDDRDSPYATAPNQRFVWIRARQLGGRMVVPGHGRQYYRLGPSDLSSPDGLSPAWPLAVGELDPWYALVERQLGLRGDRDGIPWQPDSELGRVLEPTAGEAALMGAISRRWPAARPMLGRFAPPLDALEAASLTGRLQCRQGAVVSRIDVDRSGRVSGVAWVDEQSGGTEQRVCAPLVFLCASSLESTRLLMLSRSSRSPQGLGGASGALGRYLMDHMIVDGWGSGPPLPPEPALEEGPGEGRSVYLPRFDARNEPRPGPGPGFGAQLYQFPGTQGQSHFLPVTFGEMSPRPENRVLLHPQRRDAWGIPILHIDCRYSDADLALARQQTTAIREICAAIGVTLSAVCSQPRPPGSAVHECGTARMGKDPAMSVLDPQNQCWDAQGLYLTDGASFPSQGTQNPTLTILALTARACHHAASGGRVDKAQGQALRSREHSASREPQSIEALSQDAHAFSSLRTP